MCRPVEPGRRCPPRHGLGRLRGGRRAALVPHCGLALCCANRSVAHLRAALRLVTGQVAAGWVAGCAHDESPLSTVCPENKSLREVVRALQPMDRYRDTSPTLGRLHATCQPRGLRVPAGVRRSASLSARRGDRYSVLAAREQRGRSLFGASQLAAAHTRPTTRPLQAAPPRTAERPRAREAVRQRVYQRGLARAANRLPRCRALSRARRRRTARARPSRSRRAPRPR